MSSKLIDIGPETVASDLGSVLH